MFYIRRAVDILHRKCYWGFTLEVLSMFYTRRAVYIDSTVGIYIRKTVMVLHQKNCEGVESNVL